jgi:hypothetical protein
MGSRPLSSSGLPELSLRHSEKSATFRPGTSGLMNKLPRWAPLHYASASDIGHRITVNDSINGLHRRTMESMYILMG